MKNAYEYIKMRTANLIPAMRYEEKEDVVVWQERAREKLTELLGLPLEPCEDAFRVISKVQKEGYMHWEFTFQSEEGYDVSCDLLIPDGIKEPVPGMICVQGHTHGKHISIGVPKFPGDEDPIQNGSDFALQAVAHGFCGITIEQRYMGTSGQEEDGGPFCITRNVGNSALLLGRTPIGERVWDIMRLIDVIEKYFGAYIDPKKILCVGNSGGGTATFYASCMDERIRMSIPSCSVCTFESSIMAMFHCPCNYIPGIRAWFNMGDLGGLIAPRPLVDVCGDQDEIFPLHGVKESFALIEKVYEKMGAADRCKLVVGQGGHRYYPKDAWPVILDYMKYL